MGGAPRSSPQLSGTGVHIPQRSTETPMSALTIMAPVARGPTSQVAREAVMYTRELSPEKATRRSTSCASPPVGMRDSLRPSDHVPDGAVSGHGGIFERRLLPPIQRNPTKLVVHELGVLQRGNEVLFHSLGMSFAAAG